MSKQLFSIKRSAMVDKETIIMIRVKAKEGMEERVKFILQGLIAPTRKEIGCISYHFFQSLDDATLFNYYEVCDNIDEFSAHLESPYIKALRKTTKDILAEPMKILLLSIKGQLSA